MASILSSAAAATLPDPTHMGSRPLHIVNIGIAFLVMTWVAIALRTWTRASIVKALGWDDLALMLTMGVFTAQCALMISWGVKEMHPKTNRNWNYLSTLSTQAAVYAGLCIISNILLKVALALFFLRILAAPWSRHIVIGFLVVYGVYATTYFAILTFGCGDPRKYLFRTAENECISIPGVIIPMTYVQASANALVDWIYVLIPSYTLWGLQMPKSTKILASGLILLGALGSVASLIRLTNVEGITPGRNFLKTVTAAAVWATIEPGLGITAVSLAATRPMFKRLIKSTRATINGHCSSTSKSPPSQLTSTIPYKRPVISHPSKACTQDRCPQGSELELIGVTVDHDFDQAGEANASRCKNRVEA